MVRQSRTQRGSSSRVSTTHSFGMAGGTWGKPLPQRTLGTCRADGRTSVPLGRASEEWWASRRGSRAASARTAAPARGRALDDVAVPDEVGRPGRRWGSAQVRDLLLPDRAGPRGRLLDDVAVAVRDRDRAAVVVDHDRLLEHEAAGADQAGPDEAEGRGCQGQHAAGCERLAEGEAPEVAGVAAQPGDHRLVPRLTVRRRHPGLEALRRDAREHRVGQPGEAREAADGLWGDRDPARLLGRRGAGEGGRQGQTEQQGSTHDATLLRVARRDGAMLDGMGAARCEAVHDRPKNGGRAGPHTNGPSWGPLWPTRGGGVRGGGGGAPPGR